MISLPLPRAESPEPHPAWAECLEPTRWRSWDDQSVEEEVAWFLTALVLLLKPDVIVETGTGLGRSTVALAAGLKALGRGRLWTIEVNDALFEEAVCQLMHSHVLDWVKAVTTVTLDDVLRMCGPVDLFFCDSAITGRGEEVRRVLPCLSRRGVIAVHDTSFHHKTPREELERLSGEFNLSLLHLPTPRGLTLTRVNLP